MNLMQQVPSPVFAYISSLVCMFNVAWLLTWIMCTVRMCRNSGNGCLQVQTVVTTYSYSLLNCCYLQGISSITWRDQSPCLSSPEIMKHPVSVTLVHPCMNEKTGITQLCNLFGQQFNTLDWVAKYYWLSHLKLQINKKNIIKDFYSLFEHVVAFST